MIGEVISAPKQKMNNSLYVVKVVKQTTSLMSASGEAFVIRARRAKPRPFRIAAAVAAVTILVGGGTFMASRLIQDDATTAAPPNTSAHSTASHDGLPSEPEVTPTETPAAGSSASGGAGDVQSVLSNCQTLAAAQDAVLDEAATGIGHWDEHIQAQTDAFDGKIDADELGAIFARTRLAGPDDQKRYAKVLKAKNKTTATCSSETISADQAADLAISQCLARVALQQKSLTAAADAMGDWRQHLKDMQRSRHEHVPEAQEIWLAAWRAAPPHLKAWDKASDRMDAAPTC